MFFGVNNYIILKSVMKIKMTRLTLYILFGATFLPGFLSDPFDPHTAYSIGNGVSSYDGEGIISHEIVPLRIREKRQTSISLPSTLPLPATPNKTPPSGKTAMWANKTRDQAPGQGQSSNGVDGGTNLLRNPENVFTPNNATTEQPGITINPGDEDVNGTSAEIPLKFGVVNYTQYATNYSLQEKEDNFLYYVVQNKQPRPDENYWIDLTKTKHEMLSNAHRRAATLKPKFNFPFYGHNITNLTIATGGFIYLGDQIHAWLAATQYVAPLMANFDSSTHENSTVNYLSTDTYFTVEWNQVKLHDSPDVGNFTFQTTLYKNGTIVFAYKNIPIPIKSINDTQHPVKVGLSDAYIRDRSILVIKQKTIYEYHRVDLKDKDYDIVNGSAIIFRLQETCLSFSTCETCTAENGTDFDCAWCPKLNKCSSGMDRNRQDWMSNNCEKDNVHVQNPNNCPSPLAFNISYPTPSPHSNDPLDPDDDHEPRNFPDRKQDKYKPETSQVQKSKTPETGTSAGGVIAIMFFIIVIFAAVGWIVYAYFYPHTPSGQLLIRYRPTQWAGFRRGEARYTAASIHM